MKRKKKVEKVQVVLWRYRDSCSQPWALLGAKRYTCDERAQTQLRRLIRRWVRNQQPRSPVLGIPVVAEINPAGALASVRFENQKELDIARPETWRVGIIDGIEPNEASGDITAVIGGWDRCRVTDTQMVQRLKEAAERRRLVNVRVVPYSDYSDDTDLALDAVTADGDDEPFGLRHESQDMDANWTAGELWSHRRVFWPVGPKGDPQDSVLLNFHMRHNCGVEGAWPTIASPRAGAAIVNYGNWRSKIEIQFVRDFAPLVREPFRRVVGWRIGDANSTELREHRAAGSETFEDFQRSHL